MPAPHTPPFTVTSAALSLVAEIAGEVGRMGALSSSDNVPRLRRENRIRSIHASLAIENNTLTLEQVTAVISGKRVLGPPSEIQEVKNAFAAYEAMASWKPSSSKDPIICWANNCSLSVLTIKPTCMSKYSSALETVAIGRSLLSSLGSYESPAIL